MKAKGGKEIIILYTEWGLAGSAVITRGSEDAVLLAANCEGKMNSI